jgi:hypothetical protein
MHISITQPFFVVGPLAIALRATPKREYQQQKNNIVNNINNIITTFHVYLGANGLLVWVRAYSSEVDGSIPDWIIILFYFIIIQTNNTEITNILASS